MRRCPKVAAASVLATLLALVVLAEYLARDDDLLWRRGRW